MREHTFLIKFKGEYIKDDGNKMCFEKEDGTIIKIDREDIYMAAPSKSEAKLVTYIQYWRGYEYFKQTS